MGSRALGLLLGCWTVASAPSVALALVVERDDPPAHSYLARANGGTCVAIGPRTVLTVNHVSLGNGQTIRLSDGTLRTISSVEFGPILPGQSQATDLRAGFISPDEPDLPGWYRLAPDPIRKGASVHLGAWGWRSSGIRLVCDPELGGGDCAQTCGGGGCRAGWGPWSGWRIDRVRDEQWGTNEVLLTELSQCLGPNYYCWQIRYDDNGIDTEATLVQYDSGGGLFVESPNGTFELAGLCAIGFGHCACSIGANQSAWYGDAMGGYHWGPRSDPTVRLWLESVRGMCDVEGDANWDGVVDGQDQMLVLANWGRDFLPGTGPGDANRDGSVDIDDLISVLSAWLTSCP